MSGSDAPDFSFPETVLARDVDGEMVLLDLAGEQYYGLNAVGALIVGLLTTAPRESAMVALRAELQVDPSVLTADVDVLVERLVDKGLLLRGTAE